MSIPPRFGVGGVIGGEKGDGREAGFEEENAVTGITVILYKDAAGIWWEDRFRPYVCMVVNLVLNIYLVQRIGVSGIILSTVFSLCISIPWENYTIFKNVFHCSSGEYYLKMLSYAATMAVGGIGCFWICSRFADGIGWFFVRGIICLIVPNVCFIALNHTRNEFKDAMAFMTRVIKLRRQ